MNEKMKMNLKASCIEKKLNGKSELFLKININYNV